MWRFCFVGASLIEGYGDPTRKGWVGNLRAPGRAGTVCYNLGVRGQTILQIADRAAAECRVRLSGGDRDRIVLGCSLNELGRQEDGAPRVSRPEIEACYAGLIRELLALAPVLVVGPPPVVESRMPFFAALSGLTLDFRNPDIETQDTAMRGICAEIGVPYIAVFSALAGDPTYMRGLGRSDGLHSDAAGYAAMAALIEGAADWQAFAGA